LMQGWSLHARGGPMGGACSPHAQCWGPGFESPRRLALGRGFPGGGPIGGACSPHAQCWGPGLESPRRLAEWSEWQPCCLTLPNSKNRPLSGLNGILIGG